RCYRDWSSDVCSSDLGDRQVADAVAGGCRAGPVWRWGEEGGAFLGVVAELMGEHAETTRRIAEAPSGLGRSDLIDEEGAQGLVLALAGLLGGEEESGGLGLCYAITSTAIHINTMLLKQSDVN